ncbi:MAG: hypothetical protein ABJK20_08825 [Halieaceae bacterium]
MRPLTIFLILTSFTLGISQLASGQTTPSLSSLMSAEEIAAMGLDKLSPAQQQNLVQWISQNKETSLSVEQAAPQNATPSSNATAATSTAAAAVSANASATTSVAATAATSVEEVDNFGKPAPQPDEMRSRIPGTFTGWAGDSQFVLENGQIWQQRYDTKWRTELENPEVVITRHMLGLHRMEVVGTGKTVPVKRIK